MTCQYAFSYFNCQSCASKVNCEICASEIREALEKRGITRVSVHMADKTMTLEADFIDEDETLDYLEGIGVFAD